MMANGATAAIVRLAHRGPIRARDLDALGVARVYLRRLCEQGVLEQVDRGVYRLTDAPLSEFHSLAAVSKRVPHGVVCLLSALQVHGLTTEVPNAVWLLIEGHARAPRITTPKLELVRASGAAFVHGIEVRAIEGVPVRITSPAKTVADCFRFRRYVGLEVALEALRDYLRKHRGKTGPLVEAARADRILTVMRPYLEALA